LLEIVVHVASASRGRERVCHSLPVVTIVLLYRFEPFNEGKAFGTPHEIVAAVRSDQWIPTPPHGPEAAQAGRQPHVPDQSLMPIRAWLPRWHSFLVLGGILASPGEDVEKYRKF